MWRNIIMKGGEISLGKVEKEKLKEDAYSDQIVVFPLCHSRNSTRTPVSPIKFVKLIKLHTVSFSDRCNISDQSVTLL